MESTIPAVGVKGQLGQQASDENNALRGLGVDQFLELMIAELQNQDPLSPKENTEILAQIGQMREIEASKQMLEASDQQAAATEQLAETLQTLLYGQRLSSASSLIGNEVAIHLDELLPEPVIEMLGSGVNDPSITGRIEGTLLAEGLAIELPEGRITKTDVENAVMGALSAQDVTVERVMRNEDTGRVENGVPVTREVVDHFALAGKVDRVSINDGVPKLQVGGRRIDMDDVREILSTE